MSPIYPISVPIEQICNSTWSTKSEYANLVLHIKNICSNFPSLLIAYSADEGAREHSIFIAENINEWGINVFMPDYPTPISALSYAITTKSMPIGLYIEEIEESNSLRIIPISSHGGLFDEQDLNNSCPTISSKKGVTGSTDLINIYVKQLAGFADPYIEKGLSFSNLDIPFKELSLAMHENENLSILFEKNADGPKAFISNNGCLLKIKEKDSFLSTEEISKRIAKYLRDERFTMGSILLPSEKADFFNQFTEVEPIEGNSYDLVYQAGFSNLFLGCWPDKLIAMQGSCCFGDGILAAIYYIESLRSS